MKKKLYVIERKESISKSVIDLISAFRNSSDPDFLIAFYNESLKEKTSSSFLAYDGASRDKFLPFISIESDDPDRFSVLFSAVLAPLNELFSIRYINSDETSAILPNADC